MKPPDPIPYAIARSGRGRVRHIADWRSGPRERLALCDHPVKWPLTADEMAMDIYKQMPVCANCQGKLKKLTAVKVIVAEDHMCIEGKTIAQVVELALLGQVPADARVAVQSDGCCCAYTEAVLRWHVTE